jgi:predicted transposase/invertase (TIGR01784 family)
MNLLELIKQEGLEQGIEQGMERGMKKGAEEAIRKTALQMLKEGVDKAFIARITSLPPKEVRQLAILAAQEVS